MIEPQNAITVAAPAVCSAKPRTLLDYQADLIRKFGRVPSWQELARRESAIAMQKATPERKYSDAARDVLKVSAIRRAEVNAVKMEQEILAALHDGDSITALQHRAGRCFEAVRNALRRLATKGAVECIGIGPNARWFRAAMQEAAQ